jgi:hypothetical protein
MFLASPKSKKALNPPPDPTKIVTIRLHCHPRRPRRPLGTRAWGHSFPRTASAWAAIETCPFTPCLKACAQQPTTRLRAHGAHLHGRMLARMPKKVPQPNQQSTACTLAESTSGLESVEKALKNTVVEEGEETGVRTEGVQKHRCGAGEEIRGSLHSQSAPVPKGYFTQQAFQSQRAPRRSAGDPPLQVTPQIPPAVQNKPQWTDTLWSRQPLAPKWW